MRGPSQAKLQAAQKFYRKALGLQEKGALAEAVAAYEKALAAAPDHFAILTNLGVCLGRLGRPRKALPLLQKALRLRPGEPMIEGALGATLTQLGRAEEATPLLESALRRAPRDRQVMLFLGLAYERMGRHEEALATVERAAAGSPPFAAALREVARMYGANVRWADEAEAAEKAYAADPSWLEPNVRAYFARQYLLDWAPLERLDAGAPLERLKKDRTPPGAPEAYLGDPFALLARTDDQAVLLKAAQRRADWLVSRNGLGKPAPAEPAKRPAGRPLRVGYLSSDFRDHAVMHVMAGVFRAHDPARVAIHAYAQGPEADGPFRKLVEQHSVAFRDITALTAAEAADLVRQDDLDLLVDLNGHTAHSRIEIAALRPAPVQACFLGYPGTTGASFIDYAIVDSRVAPPEHIDAFSERLVYHPVCYLPIDPEQPISDVASTPEEWGLPAEAPVFCSFNQPYKIEPVRFGVWMRILRELEGSVLWLAAMSEEVRGRFRAEAEARGVSADRLIFAERVEKERHFERLRHATAALDTRLYGGHSTTIDAMLAGVPVVTTLGAHFPGRVAAALLETAGCSDLAVPTEDSYFGLALRLAGEPAYRADVSARLLAAKVERPLFDHIAFTQRLEDLFERMVAEGPRTVSSPRTPLTV